MKFWILAMLMAFHASADPGFRYQPSMATSEKPVLKGIPFRSFSLEQFFDDSTQALVIVFAGTRCTKINQYLPALESLKAETESKGVRFLLVYPNRLENLLGVALHAVQTGTSLRPLLDVDSKLATLLNARQITEAVVLDRTKTVVYQGAIDDSLLGSSRKEKANEGYLKDALRDVLRGVPVAMPSTLACGCTVETPLVKASNPTEVTFYRDVLPIIQNRCQKCHRPGEIGEVYSSFLTYDDAYGSALTIRDFVVDRRMPPYYTYVNLKFGKHAVENQLTQTEVQTIADWVSAGAPAGNAKDAPAPREFLNTEWKIGKPDIILTMPEPFQVKANGKLEYEFRRLPMDFSEDRWVQAVEAKPGNTKVVHHIQLHLVPSGDEAYTGTAAMTKLYGIDGERGNLFHSYVPGDTEENARTYPQGQAMRIPKHSDLILEIHYTTAGSIMTDQSSVGLIFAKEAPKVEICSHGFKSRRALVKVPPFKEHHGVTKTIWFRKDVLLHNLRAHMHELGKSFRLNWVYREPAGIRQELFAAFPVFDFNWQRSIQFAEPVFIPAGQEIEMTGYWDNSRFNPNNSEPQRERIWGIHTTDEMLNVGLKFSIVPGKNPATCVEAVP